MCALAWPTVCIDRLVYTWLMQPARGPCSLLLCGSAVSHTPLFLRNQCMHTAVCSRARSRKEERERESPRQRMYVHTHTFTETESAANALTYDGLLLREAAGARCLRARICIRALARVQSARGGELKATQACLSRASFFEFSRYTRRYLRYYARVCTRDGSSYFHVLKQSALVGLTRCSMLFVNNILQKLSF